MKLNWTHLVVAIIALMLGWQLAPKKRVIADPNKEISVEVDTFTKVLVDTFFVPAKEIPPLDPIVITDTIYKDTLYLETLLTDYFTKRFYNETVLDNDSAYINIQDTIYNNRLQHRTFTYQNKQATTVTNNYYEPYNWELYAGIDLGKDLVNPKLILSMRGNQYSVGYNIYNESINIGFNRRLFKRKNKSKR